MDSSGANNHLALRSSPPMYVYSTAPLSFTDGRPVGPPLPGAGGYSLRLNDKQVSAGGNVGAMYIHMVKVPLQGRLEAGALKLLGSEAPLL
jgi:hypothetical protein